MIVQGGLCLGLMMLIEKLPTGLYFILSKICNYCLSSRQIRRLTDPTNIVQDSSQLEKYQEWLKKQLTLREKLQKTCLKFVVSVRVPVETEHFIFDPNHKLLFCRNAKVCPI